MNIAVFNDTCKEQVTRKGRDAWNSRSWPAPLDNRQYRYWLQGSKWLFSAESPSRLSTLVNTDQTVQKHMPKPCRRSLLPALAAALLPVSPSSCSYLLSLSPTLLFTFNSSEMFHNTITGQLTICTKLEASFVICYSRDIFTDALSTR